MQELLTLKPTKSKQQYNIYMNNKFEFFYYVEYVDQDGLHYAVHKWNDVQKTATRLSDLKINS